MTEYDFPFERKKRITDELTGLSEGELPKTEEVTEEKKDVIDTLTKGAKTIDLSKVDEGAIGESTQEAGERQLLEAFRHANVHFHLLAEPDIKSLKLK
jgi:hypothetical protein